MVIKPSLRAKGMVIITFLPRQILLAPCNPEYATCLGLIKAYTRYAMEIGDEQTPVGPLKEIEDKI